MKLNIAVLAGDGIGPEIVAQALRVTDVIAKKIRTRTAYPRSAGRSRSH